MGPKSRQESRALGEMGIGGGVSDEKGMVLEFSSAD